MTDFGLARLLNDDPTLTRTYQVAGTPNYMAPEQAIGDRRGLTARCDIYSMGVVLYELLVGHPPFEGESRSILNDVITTLPVPPRNLVPAVPRDLNAVFLKCLEKNPSDRYGSAQDLAADLGRFLNGDTVSARAVHSVVRVLRLSLANPASTAIIILACLATLSAIGFGIDRHLKEIQARADNAVQFAELESASVRLAWLESEASRTNPAQKNVKFSGLADTE